MGLKETDSLTVLEELTPRPGWKTDTALFSSYSLDLIAVASVAIALAGEGSDEEDRWGGSLASAVEKMRDRFKVVCQGGRIIVPPDEAREGLVVVDQWVRQVPHDGNERSWHVKLGLVRYVPVHPGKGIDQSRWLLWIGSRNLTRDISWDSALTAVGYLSSEPNTVDHSIAIAAREVAQHAHLNSWTEEVARELESVHWTWPTEVEEVKNFQLWTDKDDAMGLPDLPKESTKIVALCPFVDAQIAKAIGDATQACEKNLITIPRTLSELAIDPSTLNAYTSIYLMDKVPYDDTVFDETDIDRTGSVEIHRGLHAKIVWSRTSTEDLLWIGSSNLTSRGLNGPNSELMVQLSVKPCVGDDLANFVALCCTEICVEDDLIVETESDESDTKLNALHNRISGSWAGELKTIGSTLSLLCSTNPPPISTEDDALLFARLQSQDSGFFVEWKPDKTTIEFKPVELHQHTQLVILQLQCKSNPELKESWVEHASMNPPPGWERDRAALAKLMGPRGFLVWILSILGELGSDGRKTPWPDRKKPAKKPNDSAIPLTIPTPTLEYVLRTSIRKPERLRRLDRVLKNWVGSPVLASDTDSEAELKLNEFLDLWESIREGLNINTE